MDLKKTFLANYALDEAHEAMKRKINNDDAFRLTIEYRIDDGISFKWERPDANAPPPRFTGEV